MRLPKAFTDEIDVHHDSPVEVVLRGKAIILRPAKPTYHLDDLLNQITPENLHGEVELGVPLERKSGDVVRAKSRGCGMA